MEEVISGMAGYIPLKDIGQRILAQYSRQQFGDFRGTLLGLLAAYSYESSILTTARCILLRSLLLLTSLSTHLTSTMSLTKVRVSAVALFASKDSLCAFGNTCCLMFHCFALLQSFGGIRRLPQLICAVSVQEKGVLPCGHGDKGSKWEP